MEDPSTRNLTHWLAVVTLPTLSVFRVVVLPPRDRRRSTELSLLVNCRTYEELGLPSTQSPEARE